MNFQYSSQDVQSHTLYQNNKHLESYTTKENNSSTPTAPSGPLASSSAKRQLLSRAAVTHRFRKLKTPSKCRECDSYVYFQGMLENFPFARVILNAIFSL